MPSGPQACTGCGRSTLRLGHGSVLSGRIAPYDVMAFSVSERDRYSLGERHASSPEAKVYAISSSAFSFIGKALTKRDFVFDLRALHHGLSLVRTGDPHGAKQLVKAATSPLNYSRSHF